MQKPAKDFGKAAIWPSHGTVLVHGANAQLYAQQARCSDRQPIGRVKAEEPNACAMSCFHVGAHVQLEKSY